MPFNQQTFGMRKHASSHADGGSDEITQALDENALSLPSIDAQTIINAVNALKSGLSVSEAEKIVNSFGKLWQNASGLLQKYIKESDNILHHHDDETSKQYGGTWVKAKEITLNTLNPSSLTLRIQYKCKANSSNGSNSSKIYKNGEAYGPAHNPASTSWKTYTDDLEFAQGDKIQVYVYCNSGTQRVYIKEFRILGEITQQTLARAISENSLGDAETVTISASNTYP